MTVEHVKETRAKFPAILQPLFVPKRYKVLYGGRGGAKSWGIARALLIQGTQDPLRILCCREVMRTIADSVHRLLADQIVTLGLEDFYTVKDTAIEGRNGAEFLFAGLRTIDAAKIKSYEGVDVAWAEEAHTLSQKSLDILIPTIRAADSELWFSFNPELESDEVYKRFVTNRPESSWVQKVTYRDNPWFPPVLEAERQEFLRQVKAGLREQEDYDNIWEGACRTVVKGAVYGREVLKMIEEGRVTRVPYDPKLPVHTIWDLGWNDQTSIAFLQKVLSEARIIDYEEESFLRYDEWAKRLKDKPYVYGSHWLPHDGAHKTQQAGGASAQDQLKPLLGMKPRIIGNTPVETTIKAARMLFPRVYMDAVKTARLQECLKHYRRGIPESTGEPGAPVHDEYSHGASSFGGLALVIDQITNSVGRQLPKVPVHEPLDPEMGM